jgi:hypothetical protein
MALTRVSVQEQYVARADLSCEENAGCGIKQFGFSIGVVCNDNLALSSVKRDGTGCLWEGQDTGRSVNSYTEAGAGPIPKLKSVMKQDRA